MVHNCSGVTVFKFLIIAIVAAFSLFAACGDALAMFCSKCGNNIAGDSIFCKFCGYKIGAEPSQAARDAEFVNSRGETALSLAKKGGRKNIAAILERQAGDSFAKSIGPFDPAKIESAYEKFGDIYISFKNGTAEKITNGGGCRHPALSPDKKSLCFVKFFENAEVEMPCGDVEVTDLYAADLIKSGKPVLILRGSRQLENEAIKADVGIMAPQFSYDGSRIYYMCSYAATSNAIKMIGVKSRKVIFLTDGNSLRMIYGEKYRNHFVAAKHKYDGEDGSARDVYCLIGPDGEEIKEISAEFSDVEKEFFGQNEM